MTAMALEPPTAEQIREYKDDGTWAKRLQDAYAIGNHKMDPELAVRADYKLRDLYYQASGQSSKATDQLLAPPPAWQGMPTTGNVKLFVLLLEFNDSLHISSDDQPSVGNQIFGPENTGSTNYPLESLSAYYDRASYGLLNLQGATLGWYNPGTDRSAVPETPEGRETLVKNAINSFDAAGHDFSQYDNNDDGDIDYFAVIWTGPHGEWSTFWWGYQTNFGDGSYRVDGKTLGKYSWQWESYDYPNGAFAPKVLIHETGHALGLPDYYDYDDTVGPDGGVGGLDMMDGNWGDHNAFSKFILDWLTPTVITNQGTYPGQILQASASHPEALLIMPDASGSPFEEFFMVQYRKGEKNDTDYPTDGLVIWHVDAELNTSGSNYLYDNSYTEHKLLRLMEADGLEEIEGASARADAGDFYTPGTSFTPTSMPDSNAYTGSPSGVEVTDITMLGDTILCNVALIDIPSVSITSPAAESIVNTAVSIATDASGGSGIDHVEFFVEGVSIGTDMTPPYTAIWDPAGSAVGRYTIKAVATDTTGMSNFDQIPVFFVTGISRALVIDLGSDNASGEKIAAALARNNVAPVNADSIGAIDPAAYPLVFVCLGYFEGNHILTSAESAHLATYLDNGGRLYMEGGDFWYWDQVDNPVPVFGYFGINGLDDGVYPSDLGTISGSSGGLADGISFSATDTNNYVDHLEAVNGGTAIWENSSPFYITGVSNQSETYRTIGCSFEFGNIPDEATQTQAMSAYLSFFDISTAPTSKNMGFLPAIFELLLFK